MKSALVIVSGPSGVGKDTLIDAWHARNPRVVRVVANTTRPMRAGEEDGVDYHFLTAAEFHQKVEEDAFLEWKEVHGQFYATPRDQVDCLLGMGHIAILKIDVQGARAVMERVPDVISIFLLPPSDEELERRLRGRGTESEEKILARLTTAREEIAQAEHYQHQVVNDDIHRAVDQLEAIVREASQ